MTKSKTGVQEWAKHSFNFQKGCLNGCKYCYARRMLKRFEPEVDFDKPVLSVTETAKRLLKKKVGGVIMFPTMHDITAATKWIYAQFLCDLLMLDDKVLVVTKANKEMFDVIDFLITRCPEKFGNLELRVTIGSTDNERLKYFEPGAPEGVVVAEGGPLTKPTADWKFPKWWKNTLSAISPPVHKNVDNQIINLFLTKGRIY